MESTNLAKQNALAPKEESCSEIDVGFQESQQNQKKSMKESMKKSRSFLGKILPRRATVQSDVEAKTQLGAEAEMEGAAGGNHLPAGSSANRFCRMPVHQGQQKEVLSSSKKRLHFPMLKKKKHGLEEPLQKSALPLKNLQMQVDDCKQIITDQVRKQLDQRNAELEHSDSRLDQLLQFSHQFEKVTKRASWKFRLKNMLCLSICCWPCF